MARKGEKWTDDERRAHSGEPQGWIDPKDGYKRIKVHGKTLLFHRYLMEQRLGRQLTRKEVVHHINGDRTDNRIENLCVLPIAEHTIHHCTGSKRSAESRAKMSAAAKGRVRSEEAKRKTTESLLEYNRRKRETIQSSLPSASEQNYTPK